MEVPVMHEEWQIPWTDQKQQALLAYAVVRPLINSNVEYQGEMGTFRMGCEHRSPNLFLAWRKENAAMPWHYHVVLEAPMFSAFRQAVEEFDPNTMTTIREMASNAIPSQVKILGSGPFGGNNPRSFLIEVANWREVVRGLRL